MDFNQSQPNDYNGNQPYYRQPKANAMAIASVILGILAPLTLCTVYLPFVFGSLSILFALLSKGYEKKMQGASIAGIISSALGMFLSTATIAATVFVLLTNPTVYKEYKNQLNTIFEQQYGVSYEEWFQEYEQGLFPSNTVN